MAIVATNRDSGANDGTTSSQATNSVAFQNNALYLVSCAARATGSPTVTGITGGGLTWVQIGAGSAAAPYTNLYRGLVTSGATTGALTITYASNCTSNMWAIDEFTGVDTSGTNGSGAIVQSASQLASPAAATGAITLAAFGDATNNVAWGFFTHSASETSTVDASGGWAALANVGTVVSPVVGLLTEAKTGQDTSVSASWTTSSAWNGWAAEIKMGVVAPTISPTVTRRVAVCRAAIR